MLNLNQLNLGFPSSGNDSQNPSSDRVIPRQDYIQNFCLAQKKGKVVVKMKPMQPLESDKDRTAP